ncbi:MAG TPA: hypothetical protein VJI98_06270 [Candidatus Nanoarchaeia archaeon]|nr:hypothetical protein [Candidatus Nanoarchaeia archaeon]
MLPKQSLEEIELERSLTPTEWLLKGEIKKPSMEINGPVEQIEAIIDSFYESMDSLLVSIEIQVKNLKRGRLDIIKASIDKDKIKQLHKIITEIAEVRELAELICFN